MSQFKANNACITSLTVFAALATVAAPINWNRFISLNTDGECAYTGDGEDADFVSLSHAERQGEAMQASLPTGSQNKVTAGEAITVGAYIASDASGRAKVATTGDKILGKALTSASAAGEVIAITFSPRGEVVAA